MAQVQIHIGSTNSLDQKKYQDGDIVRIVNDTMIKSCHAENICNVKHFLNNADRLNIPGSLPDIYLQNTMEYKIVRTGEDEVTRIRLSDSSEDVFGNQTILQHFIAQSKNNPRHKLFGTNNSEYWFGGEHRPTTTGLQAIWSAIEGKTSLQESDHTKWPWSPLERKRYFIFDLSADVSDSDVGTYTASHFDDEESVEPVLLKKSRYKVLYLTSMGLSAQTLSKIADKREAVEVNTKYVLGNIILDKNV